MFCFTNYRRICFCLVAFLSIVALPSATRLGYAQETSEEGRTLYLPLIQQNGATNAINTTILDPAVAQPDSNASTPGAGDQAILVEPIASAAAGPTLAISRSGNNLQLSWTTVPGSQGYEVHRSSTPFFAPSAATLLQSFNSNTTTFTDVGVVGNVTVNHFYLVQAVNGNQKSRSNEVGEIEYALNNSGGKYSLIAVPFSNNNLTNAATLATYIGNVGALLKWNPTTQSFRFFVPPASGDNFTLTTGDVLFVLMNSGGPNVVTMTGTVSTVQFGLTAGRYHFLSVPLQKPTLTNANIAATDIGGVQALLAWNENTQSFRFFAPPSAGDNFALRGGMPFIVLTSASGVTPSWPPTLPPAFASLTGSSPADGEQDVAVTRETILEFDLPLDPASVNSTAISAAFGAQLLDMRFNLAPDGKRVTLFYNSDLPASARVRVTVTGDRLRDSTGNPVDVDNDGNAGGVKTLAFDTLTLTTLPNTSVCGRVFASEVADGANTPLQGATITVDGMENSLRTTTDTLGNFCLNPAPAGRFFVHIDGRTATNGVPTGSYYPFVGKAWDSLPGQQTNVGNIYLPLVPPDTLRTVSASQATMIGFAPSVLAQYPEFASVAITVPADSLYDDSGVRGGKVGIAPVPPDRLPGALPPGLNFPIVITVQTDGATNFDRPVPACFPNLPDPTTGQPLPAGSKSALWSFNHDTGRFEIVGPMTVSADGTLVCTDPGVGIEAPGWHGSQPGASGAGNSNCDEVSSFGIQKTQYSYAKTTQRQCKFPQDKPGQHQGDGLPEGVSKKPSANVKNLDPDLKAALSEVVQAYKDSNTGFTPYISSGNDGRHGGTSKHYEDEAVDLSSNSTDSRNYMTVEQIKKIADEICDCTLYNTPTAKDPGRLHGNWDIDKDGNQDFDVIVEYPGVKGKQHIHIEKEPKTGCFQCDPSVPNLEKASKPQNLLNTATLVNALNVSGGPYFLAIETGQTIQRTMTNADGSYSVVVPPNMEGTIHLFDPTSMLVKHGRFFSPSSGNSSDLFYQVDGDWRVYQNALGPCSFEVDEDGFCYPDQQLEGILWNISYRSDADADLLAEDIEYIIGTSPNDKDSDDDGIPDGTEIQNGTDPLDGQPARTGIIATADTPGIAVDVCTINQAAVAVADGAAGVAIFNVFNGMNPTLVAQIDTPGNAQAVACTDTRVVVADGSGGLSIINVRDPANAILERRVALSSAQAVAAFNNRAYVGAGSDVVLIDLDTGSVLRRITLGNTVQDLALGGDYLYALTVAQLSTLPLYEDTLQVLNTVSSPGSVGAGGRRWRLHAGNGILYATHTRGYNTFNLSNPAQPLLLAAGSTNQFGWKQLLANGAGLGVAAVSPNSTDDGPHEVALYDISDPTRTDRFLTQFETPGLAAALALGNGLAYVADSAAGVQVLNYLAYDSRGISPTITLAANFAQAVAEENKTMRLTALISDDVQLRNVEFYVDGVQVATDGSYPFEHRFTTPLRSAQPSFTVRAKAIDTGGNFAWTAPQLYTLVADATPPRLLTVAPLPGSFATPGVLTVITATFNEALDPATLLNGGFQLFDAGADNLPETGDDRAVAGVVSFDAPSRTARFTLGAALGQGRYRAVVAASVTDSAGNPLQGGAYSWQFSVGLISWDGGGDGVSWHDARNWERDQLPVAGASVIIPDANGPTVVHSTGETILTTVYSSRPIRLGGGRMIFNGDVTLDRILLGSELTVNGTLTTTGVLTWTGGTLSGNGVIRNRGLILLMSNGARGITGVRLDNRGVIDWREGGNLVSENGGKIENNGVIRTSGSLITRQLDVSVNGPGRIEVLAGILNLGGGGEVTTGGVFSVTTGAILQLTGSGVHTYTGSYTGSGGGSIRIGSGKVAIGAAGATFTFAGDIFQWTGGEIRGPGVLINNGRLVLTNNGARELNGVRLANRGVIDWQEGGNLYGTNGGWIENTGVVRTTGSAVTRQLDISVNGNGKIEVLSGVLNLGGGGGVTTGGVFSVTTGAILQLTGSGAHTYTGNYTGSGGGSIRIGSGKVAIGAVGATFNFGGDLFQWTGGEILGPGVLTNRGRIVLASNGARTLNGVRLNNQGVIDWQEGGNLTSANGGRIANSGIVRTSVSAVTRQVDVSVNGSGRVEVLAGTLNLGGGGEVTTGGVFSVTSGAVLQLTGSGVHTYTGSYTGGGGGSIRIGSGQMAIGAAGATFNFGGDIFQWVGGEILGPGVLTNQNRIIFTGNSTRILNGIELNNLGVIDWQGAGGLLGTNGGRIKNQGVFRTSVSAVTRQIDATFNGGKVEVLAGTLNLGGEGVTTSGIFTVATGAVLNLTASGVHTYTGNYVGSGGGSIGIGSGKLAIGVAGATFNFGGDLFEWGNGEILGPGVLTNNGRINLRGYQARTLTGVRLNNRGVIDWQEGGNLYGNNGAVLSNLATGVINLRAAGSVTLSYGNVGALPNLNNLGVIRTSTGNNNATIAIPFSGGKVEVLAGTLNLGGEGVTTSGVFTVATGAVLNLTASGVHTYTGNYVGSGGGSIGIGSGKLAIGAAGATFNFGGDLFEWGNGEILGPGILTNNGQVNLRGYQARTLNGVQLNNRGVIDWQEGGNLYANNGAVLNNLATGVINLRGSGSGTLSYGGVGVLPSLNNLGVIRTSTGNNNATIAIPFSGGKVEVLAGTLNLGGEGVTTSGVFTVATGAVLNLTAGGVHTYTGNYVGSGGGIIAIGSGKLAIGAAGATFNFGGDLFEWSYGEILGPGVLTNDGQINLRGYLPRTLNRVRLNNRGVIDWQEGGNVYINNGATLNNLATGVIELRGSGAGTLSYDGIGAHPSLSNLGIIRTSTANGNTTIGIPLTNRGVITAGYGTLTLSGGYTQTAGTTSLNGGTLAGMGAFNIQGGVLSGAGQINAGVINGGSVMPGGAGAIGILAIQGPYTQTATGQLVTELGGLATNEYDQLAVSGPVALNGSLQIHLHNGFTPAGGNSFAVLTYQSRSGAFGTINGDGQSYTPAYSATTLTITKQ